MSTAAQFLRGIDLSMTLLCLLNLALVVDSLTAHRALSSLPASAASAYVACLVYCLFNLVTLLFILLVRALPDLFRAAGSERFATGCCAVSLGVELFLLLPRTLIILSLLSTLLRSRALLLGDAAHTVFYLASALLLYMYSCAILVLDCQRVPRWTMNSTAPRPARSTDEVRVFGMGLLGGPLWTSEYSTSTRTRGLSDEEIERVTTLTTFTPAAAADKKLEDGVEEVKAAEVVAHSETRVIVHVTSDRQASEDSDQAATVDPPQYHNPPPPPPPSPEPPGPAQRTVYQALQTPALDHNSPGSPICSCSTRWRPLCPVSGVPRAAAERRVRAGAALPGTYATARASDVRMAASRPLTDVSFVSCAPASVPPWMHPAVAAQVAGVPESVAEYNACLTRLALSSLRVSSLFCRLLCCDGRSVSLSRPACQPITQHLKVGRSAEQRCGE